MASALSENPASVIHSLNLAHNTLDNQGTNCELFSLLLLSLSGHHRLFFYFAAAFVYSERIKNQISVLTEPLSVSHPFCLSHWSFILCLQSHP